MGSERDMVSAEARGAQAGERADAGLIRVTDRDLRLLRIAAEQYALTVPQLARLMDRSRRTARWLRDRWRANGWVASGPVLVGHPVFVWPTRKGLTTAGVDYAPWTPAPGMLAHITAVTDVRLDVSRRHPNAEWVSERDLARSATSHRPDGLVRMDGKEVAIEVELTLKERRRAERIMRELVAAHPAVTYFADPAPRRQLTELAEQVGGGRVQVLALPDPTTDHG